MGQTHGTSSQDVFKMFTNALSEEEVINKTGLSQAHVKKRFREFEVYISKIDDSEKRNRIIQAKGIEKELFRLMAIPKRTITLNRRISQLSHIYSTFNATQ